MKLITFILGTRPEAIKMAPLINVFKNKRIFKTRIILSGQHRDLVKEILDSFEIKHDLDLDIMLKNQTLSYVTSQIIMRLERELSENKPDFLIVQGDTNTAFAGALAAFYKKIPVGHLEAGLRTDSLEDPFPEEANRRLISQLTTLHFCPTRKSLDNCHNSS